MSLQTVPAVVQAGVLQAIFPPRSIDQSLQSLAIVGPIGSGADVWIGIYGDSSSHVDTTPNGGQNSTEYLYPKLIKAGQLLIISWTTLGAAYATADILPITR